MTQRKNSLFSPLTVGSRPFAVASLALGLSVGGGCRLCGDGAAPVAFDAAFPKTTATALRGQTNEPLPASNASAPSDAPFAPLDESFPVFDPSFFGSTPADAAPDASAETSAPPTVSELPSFLTEGTALPEPTDAPESDKVDGPRRESLADKEATEKRLEQEYADWVKKQKARQKALDKTPRYLQPISDPGDVFNNPNGPFAREERESSFIRQVTAADLGMMTDEEYSRELYDWEKEQPTPIDWSKYALTVDRIRGWLGMGPDERAALEYMRQACEKQKEYYSTKEPKLLKEAAVLYERAAERWPGPALKPRRDFSKKENVGEYGTLIEEDGLFFAGECWFFYKDYNRALVCFRALVKTYANSIYKDTAMKRLYAIGCYWTECSEEATGPSVNLTEKDKPRFSSFAGAQKAFETIFLNDASDSGLAPAALFALANAHMRRGVNPGDGAFATAAQYYKQLYEFYPGSKYAEDACRLAMIALHKSYQGPFYDTAPLEQARALAEAAQKSGRGNMDVVLEELEKIKEEQAKQLYVVGQYYEKRGNFASARAYYHRLVRDFPNSYYATEAAQSYETIAEKPAEADQFAWIRPVAPFLPKSKNQYFEEAPPAELARVARREESLDRIGADPDKPNGASETASERENVAADPDAPKRY
ncbi:MAG: tetratricopeptide repeat protein [Thermoguttaceae bacterium]|nr:tetratricopeptide repeat protein [Thermoguttaceae bacterium]